MFHICLIPGLGVDERLFQQLALDPNYPQTILRWLPPAAPDEPLPAYARRMATQIPASPAKLVLVGVSFGGIMAIELAKFMQPALTMIISSVKNRHEMPWYYRLAGKLHLPALLPLQLGKYFNGLHNYIFGAKTATESELLHHFIRAIDLMYLRWSLTQIANWPHTGLIPNLVHLHGTHDKIFPTRYLKKFTPVVNGAHLMILSEAAVIRSLIQAEIDKLEKQTDAEG